MSTDHKIQKENHARRSADPQILFIYFLFVFVFEMSVAEFLTRLLQLHEKFARDEKFTYESLCLCVYMCVGGWGEGVAAT